VTLDRHARAESITGEHHPAADRSGSSANVAARAASIGADPISRPPTWYSPIPNTCRFGFGGGAIARAGLTAERLAQAGAELADEEGFENVTVSGLARRAGVKAASLYAHIASSEELRVRIAVLALDELADRGDAAVAGRAGRDALFALANVYRDYAAEHPGRNAATRQPFGTDSTLDPEVARTVLAAGARHARLARAIMRGYDLAEPEQTHAVRLMGSVFQGFVSLELGGGFSQSEPASAQSWTRILTVLDNTLRNWSTP
jgi:AcrR family transcriptional regulator